MSYRTLMKLAAGGTATVYIGTSSDAPDQLLALKKPHPHLFDDPRFITALCREAAIASRLDHPNVVRVRELVNVGDNVELVMDYVDGVSLSDLIRAWDADQTKNTLAAAIRIALDVCAGLAAAHALKGDDGEPLGVIHRDVSPQNVLIGTSGVAKLADFGLTRSIAFGDRSTTDGVLKGKAGYLAPEYVRGAPIDQRIDIFALGVVLWESITKTRLFRGENEADTLQRILKCEIPPVASADLDPKIACDLDVILARALSRSPADRFANVGELSAALEDFSKRHALTIDHAAVTSSFGTTVHAAIEKQKAAIAIAQKASVTPSRNTASASRRVALVAIPAALIALAVYEFRPAPKIVPIANPAEIAASGEPAPQPMSGGFEIIDAVPLASSPEGSSSAQRAPHRVVRSKIPGAASSAPPQPRPNPY